MSSLHVVVIGAGIVGAALADQLTTHGAAVTLVDAAEPGQDTSATSLGWINANRKTPRHYYDLNLAGMRAWHHLAAEFGDPGWYHPTGDLTWTVTEEERAELHERVNRLRDWGYDAEWLTPEQTTRLEPELALPPDRTVAHFPHEGYADAGPAATALAARAQQRGATLHTHDPVVHIDTRSGHARSAHLASGVRVDADVVVLAAGHHSPSLAALLGADIDLVPPDAPGSQAVCLVATTTPLHTRPRRLLHGPELRMRPDPGGGLHLEASDTNTSTDLTSSNTQLQEAADRLLARAHQLWPSAIDTRIAHVQRCIRPLPRDGYPIVGWTPEVDGVYVAVTHSGVTLAPHLATLITSEILHDQPAMALNPYRPGRNHA